MPNARVKDRSVGNTDKVTVTTVVAVDPGTAFEVFTQDVDAWWARGPQYRFRNRDGVLRFEPGVGGRLVEVYDPATGDEFEVGRILVWQPGQRLVFAFRGRNYEPRQRTEVDVRFDALKGGTRVTLEHRGWDSLPPGHPARHGLTGSAFTAMISQWWADRLAAMGAHVRQIHGGVQPPVDPQPPS